MTRTTWAALGFLVGLVHGHSLTEPQRILGMGVGVVVAIGAEILAGAVRERIDRAEDARFKRRVANL